MATSSASSSASSPSPSLVDSLFQRSLDDVIKSLRSDPAGESAALCPAPSPDISPETLPTPSSQYPSPSRKLTYRSPPSTSFPTRFPYNRRSSSSSSRSQRLPPLEPSPPSLSPSTRRLPLRLLPPPPVPPPTLLPRHAPSPQGLDNLSPPLPPLLPSHFSPPRRHPLTPAAQPSPPILPPLSRPLLPLSPQSIRRPPASRTPLPPSRPTTHAPSPPPRAFCELSAPPADPAPYLPLAPDFYRILATSRNNWVLIKVLKIFSRLAPLEPRLPARIADPVCQLLRGSTAKSLVLECVRTVLSSLSAVDDAVKLAIEKTREFLAADDDPNLRYLGLQCLAMLGPEYSWAVEESHEAVLRSLTDSDPNIRREALRLMMRTVVESSAVEVSSLLISQALKSDPEFANEILGSVLATCGRNLYELIADFDWYVSLLGEMARNPHCNHGAEIERQLVDIGLRVRDARPELVRVARDLLIDPALLGNHFLCRILSAAAWISGEYVEFSKNPVELVEALLQPRTSLLPASMRAVYVQAVLKVLSFCCNSYIEQLESTRSSLSIGSLTTGEELKDELSSIERKDPFSHESILYMINLIETAVGPLAQCDEVEVQERARNVLGFIRVVRDIRDWKSGEEGLDCDSRISEIVKLLHNVFSEELGPVSASAQKRVSLPEDLILNENLADLASFVSDDDTTPSTSITFYPPSRRTTETKEEPAKLGGSTSLLAEHRKRHGLYYLPSEKNENELNDYPHANDPLLPVRYDGSSEEVVKLSEQSFVVRKTKNSKPRPKVVKLDEDESVLTSIVTTKKESVDDPLSGAIRDVLLGKEGKPSSSQKKFSDRSSRGMQKDDSESTSQLNENLELCDREHGSSSSRKSRHRSHNKERDRSPGKNEEKGEKSHRSSTRSSHHHGRHKHRQRADAPLAVVPQAPVIQDFLL
ncbi:LOW QUALITY PROTEIN: AP-3 complex subunit delta [Ananas comosus]|uniref:LOW QUALITY PROTEIN: AP-3 complex subunit delta n=1 Tax=Ananas comosus TaxID=4615 RepID=A0A6P5FRS7_ANACO|nr:LOW QUALITY PROTEIN: AP-3 complex subunit delta [Ananas comosus]